MSDLTGKEDQPPESDAHADFEMEEEPGGTKDDKLFNIIAPKKEKQLLKLFELIREREPHVLGTVGKGIVTQESHEAALTEICLYTRELGLSLNLLTPALWKIRFWYRWKSRFMTRRAKRLTVSPPLHTDTWELEMSQLLGEHHGRSPPCWQAARPPMDLGEQLQQLCSAATAAAQSSPTSSQSGQDASTHPNQESIIDNQEKRKGSGSNQDKSEREKEQVPAVNSGSVNLDLLIKQERLKQLRIENDQSLLQLREKATLYGYTVSDSWFSLLHKK